MIPKAAGRRGFTLAEIMVAMSIFLMIGGMLLMALRAGVDTWSRTEEQRMIHEDAQAFLRQVREDLTSLASTGGSSGDPRVQLLCDFDAARRQRIRFIRTIKAEDARTLMRLAGTGTPEQGYTEHMTDVGDAGKKLMPLGGLMEVAYLFDPSDPLSTVLYRGVRAPIGGDGSLFVNSNIDTTEKVAKCMNPLSSGVLFLGFLFWSQYTSTWNVETGLNRSLGGECGPEVVWDSTRGILPSQGSSGRKNDLNVFFMAANSASRDVAADDVFPRQIQVTLVLRKRAGFGMSSEIVEDLSAGEKTVRIADSRGFPDETDPDAMRYVRIGAEWVRLKGRTGDELEMDRRGARGTVPQAHKAGQPALCGRTFIITASVPAYREFWFGDNPVTGAASK